jgi:hypothetical protein
MPQLVPSIVRRTPSPAPAIKHKPEGEWAGPTGVAQAWADVVRRRRWAPITIGMFAGGLTLGAFGVAVAASYSYATEPDQQSA